MLRRVGRAPRATGVDTEQVLRAGARLQAAVCSLAELADGAGRTIWRPESRYDQATAAAVEALVTRIADELARLPGLLEHVRAAGHAASEASSLPSEDHPS